MKNESVTGRPTSRHPYMVAVVLGTALSALGTAPARADQIPDRAVVDISRYCTSCWRNARLHPDAWTDCTQEVFARLLERLSPDAWTRVLQPEGDERREFIRAIDAVKKRTQRMRKWSPADIDAVADRRGLQTREVQEDRDAIRQAANELLSPRQQRILQMSFEGWSVQEIANELILGVERVSDEKYKAIRKLREHVGRNG